MRDFVIHTDSSCDLKPDLLNSWGVSFTNLNLTFDDEGKAYACSEIDVTEFYDRMRQGGIAKTSAANVGAFLDAFEPIVSQGKDVLYLAFSSGLSTTCNSAAIAANQLKEAYPDAEIRVVDTLAASAGQGLLVDLAVQKKRSGATLAETAAYVEDMIPRLCHWFTVDDLEYLKRGGRVSAAVALVGGILGIKPVLHVDDGGHLVKVTTARDRKNAIKALADRYTQTACAPDRGAVYISHGDCRADAEKLAEILQQRHGVDVTLIADVGPVIGAHSGPGTLALFYVGSGR